MSGLLNKSPLWLRLVAAVFLMLAALLGGTITYDSRHNRESAIEQAAELSLSFHDATLAGLTAMMITDTMPRANLFLDQIKELRAIRELRVIAADLAFEGVEMSKNSGNNDKRLKPTAQESQVIGSGKELVSVQSDEKGPYLQVIRPMRNSISSPDTTGLFVACRAPSGVHAPSATPPSAAP